ncbi:MAG: hypothetical protein K9L17_11185 [Clostridiales bacterium]|nr:hypothetical protein [Clostridiales bacterium]MCF8023246.1 hypothetical protein [Clostridiales bacterium]
MIIANPNDIPINKSKVLCYLGYKIDKNKVKDIIFELLDEQLEKARTLIVPRGVYRVLEKNDLVNHKLFFDAQKIAFGVCTIGNELEQEVKRLFACREYTRGVLLDSIGSVSAEAITDIVNDELNNYARQAGLNITRRFSPGYGEWDVQEQKLLFNYMGNLTAGVRMLPSGLMLPIKSVSFACKISNFKMKEVNKGDKCLTCNMRHKCLYNQASKEYKKEAKPGN